MQKPSLIIGSSTKRLEFARALCALLSDAAEATLWNEGFLRPGGTFIDTLVNSLPRFDFAALVLTPDDFIQSRDLQSLGPHDNVLFELGLFMGRLGRARTFLVHQTLGELKIPSDLRDVTAATCGGPRQDRNYLAIVGPACDSIRQTIRDLGFAETKTTKKIRKSNRGSAGRPRAPARLARVGPGTEPCAFLVDTGKCRRMPRSGYFHPNNGSPREGARTDAPRQGVLHRKRFTSR